MLDGFAFTYVLRLTNGDLYIGSTDNLERRVQEHSSMTACRTTRISMASELVYVEACRSLEEARKRESQLKTGYGRAYLKRRLSFELRGNL